jgi:hypothetical protein
VRRGREQPCVADDGPAQVCDRLIGVAQAPPFPVHAGERLMHDLLRDLGDGLGNHCPDQERRQAQQ